MRPFSKKMIRLFYLPMLVFPLLIPIRVTHAGDGGPGCAGWVCGKTYYSDEDYAYQSLLRTMIGQRSFEMFPNFYRLGYSLWGGLGAVLGHPAAQKGLEVMEQASYGTPGVADDALIRSLRNLPRVAAGLDESAGVIGAIGTGIGGRGLGRTHTVAEDVAEAVAEAATLPDMPAVGRSLTTPARKFIPGETPYLEFDVGEASLFDDYIRMGGNATGETGVAISPWGDVVIFEGKHRAVGAAVGQAIPESLGGVPGMPSRLRYEYVGGNITPEGWARYRERFKPVQEIIQNPEKVEAALSGSVPWVEIKLGQPIRLR